MDTSESTFANDHHTTKAVLGGKKTPLKDISPKAWLMILEEIYHNEHAQVPCIYERIGDLCGGKDPFVEVTVPRGAILFDKGLGVNTLVHRWPIDTENTGEQIVPDSPKLTQYRKTRLLLLVKPEPGAHKLVWAEWVLEFVLRKDDKDLRRILCDSRVRYLTEEGVLEIFRTQPDVALGFINIGTNVDLYAEELIKKAYRLGQFAAWVKSVYYDRLQR